MPTSRLTTKYRLYPTPAQITNLRCQMGVCCDVYNSCINWRKHDWELLAKSPTCFEQVNRLPIWKQTHPELKSVYSQTLQQCIKRVDLAYDTYFDRVKDYKWRKAQGLLKEDEKPPRPPESKPRSRYRSLTYTHAQSFSVSEKSITLSKVGTIKAVVHRPIQGIAKTCVISVKNDKWYACFSCEVECTPLPACIAEIGIDVGIKVFAAFSDGTFIGNPTFYRTAEKSLAKAQRKADKLKYARTKADKVRKHKANKAVRLIHERTANQRHDFHHQQSRKIVNENGRIVLEDLSVKNMMACPKPKPDPENTGQYLPNGSAAKAGLNKSIADVGWSTFRSIVTYKAENAGRVLIDVNPAYTSQDCSGCGHRPDKKDRKKLKDRVHKCPNCSLVLDRDINAARNILKLGLKRTARLITISL